MSGPPDAARVRALAERLVAIPTVSPDPAGESACARAVLDALPAAAERGTWSTSDGRPVVWARLGSGRRGVLLLGHYDTVGADEYAILGHPAGAAIAFRPDALRAWLLEGAHQLALDPEAVADLEEERRAPGTWAFGRGALDMKSGVAAGIAALEHLAPRAATLPGSALLMVCPDEENASAGMRVAVRELARAVERRELELIGALNLDFTSAPTGHAGVLGKALLGIWVLGSAGHAGDPPRAPDAARLAAELVVRLTGPGALAEPGAGGGTPTVLRLRDLKPRYDLQAPLEAWIELNLLLGEQPIARLLEQVRAHAVQAIAAQRAALAPQRGAPHPRDAHERVLMHDELLARAGGEPDRDAVAAADDETGRARTLERVRALAHAARLGGPAVVLSMIPPYYPAAGPGNGPVARGAALALAQAGLGNAGPYPYVTDAAYVAWRSDPVEEIRRYLPALGREYDLPAEQSRRLDLDVVSVGPWGRDAHGLLERVHAPFAFGRLPGLIVRCLEESWRS